MNSNFLSLNWRDVGKGLVVAVLVAILQVVLGMLQGKGLAIALTDWQGIGDVALKAGAAYLLKNLFSTTDGKFLGSI